MMQLLDLTFLLDKISAYSTTELNSCCTGIRRETEMQREGDFFSSHAASLYSQLHCKIDSGPRVVGLEGDESQQESSTSS